MKTNAPGVIIFLVPTLRNDSQETIVTIPDLKKTDIYLRHM